MQGPLKALQQIAFGHLVLPSGKTRRMYNYEIINLAREACDQLGIAYCALAPGMGPPPRRAGGLPNGLDADALPVACAPGVPPAIGPSC
jgi:hypothetical protein